jgi:hypothetical protein
MSVLDPALIRIDKARLHNARLHDASRLTRALDQLKPASIGLSPRATLIVRRLAPATPLARSGSTDRFVAGLRDDLRARIVSARRGSARDDEDLFFEDDVALETALVREWLRASVAGTRRSWTHVIDAGTPLTRWRRHILPDDVLLPRVIARLVAAGNAEHWLNQFDRSEIQATTTRLFARFGASVTAATLRSPDRPPRPDSGETERANPTSRAITRIAPEAHVIIQPDVRRIVALALIIVRRPTLIVTRAFAAHLEQFAIIPTKIGAAAIISGASFLETPPSLAHVSTHPATKRRQDAHDIIALKPAAKNLTPTRQPIAPETAIPVAIERPTIHSGYAGLFFLLNSFLVLRLYGDFTQPGDGLKGLSPFELMHMLATRWFGASFKTDPIAALLITLAGLEPGDRPGRLFEPPQWAVPDDWLLPWSGVKRPGFPLTDHRTPTRQRWINNLSRYLAARLKRALDTPDAVAITCTQPGRIVIDGDRINIHFPLADHPIALRFAGLDRDPGWVPAAAHFIEFSFT